MTEVQVESAISSEAFLDKEKESVSQSNSPVENGSANTSNENASNEGEVKDEESEWMDILGSGQIKKKVLVKGEEDSRPQSGDICEITFEGRLSDGTVIEAAEKCQINLADGEVVQGLDLVLTLMDEGEKALVEIGPRFAFGSIGRPAVPGYPAVPENETVTYTLELHSVKPPPSMEEIPISERKKIGNKKRERGNWWYGRKENTLAVHCYRRALDYLDEAVGGITVETKDPDEKEDEALKDLLEDRLKVYNNLAAAQLKIGALDAGLTSLNHVLMCQPENVKAIFRKAKILSEKGEMTEALELLQKALKLEPSNKIVQSEVQKLKIKAKEASAKERNLYRKMLGGSDSEASRRGDRESSSRSKLFPWGMVFGSVAVVLAGMVAYRYKFI